MTRKTYGILLINLGTPDAPTPKGIRAFLKPFLSDRRIIDLNRFYWLPALHGFILPRRPHKIRHLYENIWTKDGSPLALIAQAQAKALQEQLDQTGQSTIVKEAMVIGNPNITDLLDDFLAQGVDHLILLPLFPQYSSTTTATGLDAFTRYFAKKKGIPPFDFIHSYHDHPAYIQALADSIHLAEDETLLFSFHGIPQRYADEGDYYPKHCQRTAELVAQKLGLADDQWLLSYQSRFGREVWLKPYTDETMAALPAQGIDKLAVICPGFAADCLETLEEINITNRRTFLEAGGKNFRYIPALNAQADHIALLAQLVRRYF
ncbi:ferrochelatase [Streptococcus sp. DD13]|uniref:ferrochelatase n=1 Tax=Streptococcus sp. DD13 TaxID=1777881 RepID=UPI000791F7A7|nr:ferrochelatase [Streptococcus sp. DD13]KXT77861.1 Ferrochelatase, protoheme ferro-lyase [Streptococcus sp. DD13]